jgi:hypothetical protein
MKGAAVDLLRSMQTLIERPLSSTYTSGTDCTHESLKSVTVLFFGQKSMIRNFLYSLSVITTSECIWFSFA